MVGPDKKGVFKIIYKERRRSSPKLIIEFTNTNTTFEIVPISEIILNDPSETRIIIKDSKKGKITKGFNIVSIALDNEL
jgi:hypothetical protein